MLLVLTAAIFGGLIIAFRYGWIAHREESLRTVRAMRWWMLFANLPMFVVVVLVGLLGVLYLPFGDVGWWSLLGGSGNVAFAQTESGPTSLTLLVLAVAVPLMLAIAIPALAHREEEEFRGSNHWATSPERLRGAVHFGAIHLVMGIPIGLVPALIIMGLYYDAIYEFTYRRILPGRIEESGGDTLVRADIALARTITRTADETAVDTAAAVHAIWNWTIIVAVVGLLIS